jgi:hypothetical protein
MDISSTTAPDSTQVNADDLIAGPVTVSITDVTKGSAEQPVDIHLAEYPDRVYRPGKSMRRVIVACWGPETSEYVGRRMRLYRDPSIRFGKDAVGGIRISHLSHIDEAQTIALTVTRGKRAPYIVEPLVETAASIELDELRAAWKHADPAEKERIEARVAELQGGEQ